jgi:hypothetical protein
MPDRCYICRQHQVEAEKLDGTEFATLRVSCPRCGVYDIAHKFIAGERTTNTHLTDDERFRLSHAIRRATDAHGRFGEFGVLGYDSLKEIAAQHPLPDPLEQADLLIDFIARLHPGGDAVYDPGHVWAARLGVKDSGLVSCLAKDLSDLVVTTERIDNSMECRLTLAGWKRARELRQHRGPGNQAFVAMWFDPALVAAYKDGFVPALTDTGHSPYRVDFATHNNKIDDEIVAEIRRSKLVVVDTTGARPNAYWEAGFANGLGIPVVWCCSDSPTAPGLSSGKWTDNLPFDVRQHAFTFWSDPADLRQKLTARIRALGFHAAWNRGER